MRFAVARCVSSIGRCGERSCATCRTAVPAPAANFPQLRASIETELSMFSGRRLPAVCCLGRDGVARGAAQARLNHEAPCQDGGIQPQGSRRRSGLSPANNRLVGGYEIFATIIARNRPRALPVKMGSVC